ncbi:hypothetical protein E2C01_075803 [Portunus trituberculatus]|uniref:Uncharacterized protein n=1 Tax=Portunus trituberculatus TaxID=210409 RepID=A0A5B7II13_PORTR|nr:hypothetical protein [Portunus trituberculatus]
MICDITLVEHRHRSRGGSDVMAYSRLQLSSEEEEEEKGGYMEKKNHKNERIVLPTPINKLAKHCSN